MRAALALAAAAAAVVSGGAARDAAATPALARGEACARCHATPWPALNADGRRFLEDGYRWRDAAAPEPDAAPARDLDRVGLSLRLRGAAELHPAPADGEGALDLVGLAAAELHAAGALPRGISYAVAVDLERGVHHGAIGVHDLGPVPGVLAVRAGRLLLLAPGRTSHRAIAGGGSPGLVEPTGLNPTALDVPHLGVAASGRVLDRITWTAAIVQGAQQPGGLRDLDGRKDVFARAGVDVVPCATVAAFVYLGDTQLTDTSSGVTARFTDRSWTAGVELEGDLVFGQGYARAVRSVHHDPFGTGVTATTWVLEGELAFALADRWHAIARYDQTVASREPDRERIRVTLQLGWLVLDRLRVTIESRAALDDVERSAALVGVDLSL